MDHIAILQRSIDYIEENLRAEISDGELAQMAGFSRWHYSRMFRKATGMSVQHFILRRRLLHAGYAMSRGTSGIDAALGYGFDTYAGFYRAFVREFGCTPSEFLRSGRGRKPWRINLEQEEYPMMTHKTAARVLEHWGMERQPLTDALVASTNAQRENMLQVGSEHLLKCSANLGSLKNHLELARVLGAMGLRAEIPVPTTDGREIVADGELWYILTRRIEGAAVTAQALLEPETARQAGAAIGALHRALEQLDVPVEEQQLPQTLGQWALPAAKEPLELTEDWCRRFLAQVEALWPRLPRQIIHRDLCPGNLIRGSEGWGFQDFQLSQRNVRIYDVAYAAAAVLSETFPDGVQRWRDCYEALVSGYDSAAGLSEDERRALPLVLVANQMVCTAWFTGQEKYRELFEVNRRMTKWLLEQFGI